jgi:hypothetical protein
MIALTLLAHMTALAADPQVNIDAAGGVVGTMLIDASAAQVRSVVGDAVQAAELSPDVVSVKRVSSDSGCDQLVTETKGMWRNLRYTSRRCPTADGWDDNLVESSDFNAYESTWALREVDGGTHVTVRVHTDVNLPVPASMVQKRSSKSVGELLENLARKVVR